MTFRSKALRDTAKGAPCMVYLPGCCDGGGETTVWAHSDQSIHGKGMAEKAHDCFGAYACASCHAALPTLIREAREHFMRIAMDRTLLYLFQSGRIHVGQPPREKAYKQGSKILPRRGVA